MAKFFIEGEIDDDKSIFTLVLFLTDVYHNICQYQLDKKKLHDNLEGILSSGLGLLEGHGSIHWIIIPREK